MSRKGNSSVLLGALVAVVAVVGLVMFGNSAPQGAQTVVLPAFHNTLTAQTGRGSTDYVMYDLATQLGRDTADACLAKLPQQEVTHCCGTACTDACAGQDVDLCQEKCNNVCQNTASRTMGIQLRSR